jgi:hypothetical protein
MSSLAVDYSNPAVIRKAGIEALTKELGPLGMVMFIRQYDSGHGDYTEERDGILAEVTLEDIEKALSPKENVL